MRDVEGALVKLTRSRLERSPEETSRFVCLELADEAAEALERLKGGGDEEALHDFRVALRRLRSVLRAYRPYLKGSSPKKLRKRLKALASSTNPARDAEVQIAWLTSEAKHLEGETRSGAERLLRRLQSKRRSAPGEQELRSAFEPLRKDLIASLSRMRLPSRAGAPSFLSATGTLLTRQADTLKTRLGDVGSVDHVEALHQARIEAKRLRYLLEPLRPQIGQARSLVGELKSLQDALGELQDIRVMTEEITAALETSALEQARKLRDRALGEEEELPEEAGFDAPARAGLVALLKVQRDRRRRRFREIETRWLGEAGAPFFRDVERLVEALSPEAVAPGAKRRLLLETLPPEVRGQTAELVREGWLPGKTIRERVRSVRSGPRTRYERILETEDEGPPLVEPLSRSAFDAFWPLTAKRRLERRRYHLSDGGTNWIVEEILGRKLVFAESPKDVEIPDWIQRTLVREITGSKHYEPESLAASEGGPATGGQRDVSSSLGS